MSDNDKELKAQIESYSQNTVMDATKRACTNAGVNEELIEQYLQNGRDVKASGKEKIEVHYVVHTGLEGPGSYDYPATIYPQTHINEEGYVTHAWFNKPDIHEHHIKKMRGGGHKILMSPMTYRPLYPIKYFRCYIDGREKKLLPYPLSE